MKKILYVLTTLIIFISFTTTTYAELTCTEQAVKQMANIVCHEYGLDAATDSNLNFYTRMTIAGVIFNKAYTKSGNGWYDRMMQFTDNEYDGYSSYKNKDFYSACSASSGKQAEFIYIAGLLLNNHYLLPKNIRLQANQDIVEYYGHVWDSVPLNGFDDMYFGWLEKNDSLATDDVYGNTINDTSKNYYRQLAQKYRLASYSKFTSANVCSLTKNIENASITYSISYDLVNGKWGSGAEHPTSVNLDTAFSVSKPEKTVVINFDANGTGAGATTSVQKAQTFGGWRSSASDGLGNNAKSGTSSSSLTSWNGATTKNNIFKTLRDSDGTVKLTASWQTVEITLPKINVEGKTCSWNTMKDGNGIDYPEGEAYIPNGTGPSTVTLYAVCQNNTKKSTVIYNANGGDNAPLSQVKIEGVNLVLSNEIPTREGFTFVEWNTLQEGNGTPYMPGDVYTEDKNLILYALWNQNKKKPQSASSNPQTGNKIIIFPLIAIILFAYITIYIRRMKEIS